MSMQGNCGDNVYYNFNSDNGTLTISGTGEMEDYTWGKSPWYTDKDNITSIIVEEGVTSIGNYSFINTNITNISLPTSLVTIGEAAFYYSSLLKNIVIPENVTIISKECFYCSGLETVTLNDKLEYIGESAFSDCYELTGITIPSSLRTMERDAFNNCHNLKSVIIQNGLETLGEYVFSTCGALQSIVLPDSLLSISDSAFDGCSSLVSITLPNSIQSIDDYAFRYCETLESITLNENLETIGNYAFQGCTSLKTITLNSNCKFIGEGAFNDCREFENIIFNNKLETIGNYAFEFTNLTTLDLPESLLSIGSNAFDCCSELTHISIPSKLTLISEGCFSGTIIETITIPSTVHTVGSDAFFGCSNLAEVLIEDGVVQLDSSCFSNCSSLTEINIPSSVTTIDNAFAFCDNLTTININKPPNSITNAPWGADNATVVWNDNTWCCGDNIIANYKDSILTLSGTGDMYTNIQQYMDNNEYVPQQNGIINKGIKEVVIEEGITGVYFGCYQLHIKEIYIPKSVTRLLTDEETFFNDVAFHEQGGCFGWINELTSITGCEGLVEIGDACFSNCTNLVNFPKTPNLQKLGYNAFLYCNVPVIYSDVKTDNFIIHEHIGYISKLVLKNSYLSFISNDKYEEDGSFSAIDTGTTFEALGIKNITENTRFYNCYIPTLNVEKIYNNTFGFSYSNQYCGILNTEIYIGKELKTMEDNALKVFYGPKGEWKDKKIKIYIDLEKDEIDLSNVYVPENVTIIYKTKEIKSNCCFLLKSCGKIIKLIFYMKKNNKTKKINFVLKK